MSLFALPFPGLNSRSLTSVVKLGFCSSVISYNRQSLVFPSFAPNSLQKTVHTSPRLSGLIPSLLVRRVDPRAPVLDAPDG